MNHHQTLLENTRKHREMRDLWSLDTNQDRYQDWDKAKLKVLIVILSSYEVKAISNTYTCISTLMKDSVENWTDMFIDACFYPSQPMQEKLTELGIPMMTGIASHRDWRDYDIVAVSHSISLEALNIPHIYSHSNFPLSHEERFSDPNCPLVIYGGAASTTMFPSLGGKIKDHGTSLYDIGSLGMGEPILPSFFKYLYNFNLEHPIKSNKQLLIDNLLDQEIFRTRLFFPFLYNISHSKGRITSIERLDSRIPEKVKLNRIHFPNFKGFYRKYFAPNGIACERHDVQVASGCSSYCCSFKVAEGTLVETEGGLERIENLVGKPQMLGALNHEKASAIWEQSPDEVYRVTTDQGVYLDGSKDHKCLILEGRGLKEVLLKDLKEGDKVLIRKGQHKFGDYQVFSDGTLFNEDRAELIGFMIGDGFMSSKNTEIQVFYKPSEEKIHTLLIQEFGDHPIRLQHTCKDGTPIYCYDKRIKSVWFEELKIRVTSLYQRVPDVVFKSPKSVIQAFLRGLFTAEGFTYSKNSRHLGFTTVSYDLSHDVNLLLLMLSYNCRIIVGDKHYYEYLKKRSFRQTYQVVINGVEDFNRFYNEVGFLNKPYRQEKESRCLNTCKLTRELLTDLNLTRYPKYRDLPDLLNRLSYTGIVRNISDRFFITHVKSVEPLNKTSRMFDITVDGSHTCIYNGLLTHNCATGDTKIQTTQGVKLLKDIKVGDKVWDRTKFVEVTRWFDMGIKPVLQIRTHLNHLIKVTPDHKIKIFDGDKIVWRKAGAIAVGDQIPLSMKGGFCQTLDLSLNECMLIGLLVGDGYYDYDRIRFCVNEEESKALVKLLISEGLEYHQTIQARNVQRFDIRQGRGHNLYKRWGLSNYTEEGKTKPSVIDQMSESQLKAFFCGLFSADGTVDKHGAISISTKFEWLADCVQYNLLRLGYITSYHVDHRLAKADDKYGFKEQERTLYRVFIKTKDSRERFSREIGFIHPHKQEKIEGLSLQENGNWTFSCSKELKKLIVKTGDIHSGSKNVSISNIRKVYGKGIEIADTIIDENLFIDSVQEVTCLSPEKVYDITVDDSEHLFVGNSALYSNCAEGQEGGHYTEKPIEEIEQDILESKCYSAANNYNAFSFNCNYYSQYFDMLKLFITHSSSTSIFNQRADVLGNSPDYVAAARKMGVMKISTACEGISERIRQNILNKNLPRKTLVQACRNVFIQKMLGLKFTMILTGLETQEDLEDFYSTIDEILRVRTECHSNTKISLTFTPLLYYIQTPFRWVKRVTSKASWEHERILVEMIPFLMDRGIKMKFYGSGITTYFEQLVIDSGWQSTNLLVDLALKHNIDYTRGILDSTKPIVEELLKEYDIPYDFFFDGFDPDKDILPNDMLEFTTPKKLEEWKEMYKKNDYYHPICLRTPANMNAKCFNCGGCSTIEEKRSVFARSLNDKSDLNSVLAAMTKAKPKSVIRFVVKQLHLYAFYSKEMLSHYITSQFIRRDEKIQKAFYKIGFNSTTWVSDNFQLPMYSGLFIYDVEFKQYITTDYLKQYKDEINSVLETCQIVDILQGDVQDEVDKSGLQLYLCKIPFYTPNKLKDRLLSFDWKVKVAKKAFPSVKFVDEDFTPYKDNILFKESGLEVVMAVSLPIIYHPFSIISSITKKPLDYCYMNADVQILDTGKEIDASCKCGNHLYYSLTNNKIIKDCPRCRLRKILSVIK